MPSEELDLECPLVDSLLQSFPDLDHDIVNEAVDDLLQTLEQMQAEAAGSDVCMPLAARSCMMCRSLAAEVVLIISLTICAAKENKQTLNVLFS